MFNFYVDDAYLKNQKNDQVPIISALGGILIDQGEEKKLIEIIKAEKKKYTHENMPLKWNFRDTMVKGTFDEFDRIKEYEVLLTKSREVRLNILTESLSVDYKILVSCIRSFSVKKEIVESHKKDFSTILFENLIFRVANEAKEKGQNYQVIMDWPTDGDPKPFNRAYYYLFNTNETVTGNKNYGGMLKDLNFQHSLFFAKCTHSPCLQFSDFIIGSFKDFVEMKLHGKESSCLGKEAIDIVRPKFRKKGKKVVGYGVITPSGNESFKNIIIDIFDEK